MQRDKQIPAHASGPPQDITHEPAQEPWASGPIRSAAPLAALHRSRDAPHVCSPVRSPADRLKRP